MRSHLAAIIPHTLLKTKTRSSVSIQSNTSDTLSYLISDLQPQVGIVTRITRVLKTEELTYEGTSILYNEAICRAVEDPSTYGCPSSTNFSEMSNLVAQTSYETQMVSGY